jgi:hypothetical protein
MYGHYVAHFDVCGLHSRADYFPSTNPTSPFFSTIL